MTKGIKQNGGTRPGAGRPKGSLGLKCREQIEENARLYPDWSPLRQFAEVANDTSLAPEIRLDAAKCAAPYVHARLKMTEADPDALLQLEEGIAEIRARHNARALKDTLGLAGLADRLDRARLARADHEFEGTLMASAAELAPVVIEHRAVPHSPSAGSEPTADAKDEPVSLATADVIAAAPPAYQPILAPWPDTATHVQSEYDVLGAWGLKD